MHPPNPPPVIRAPSAPCARAVSTARSTVGTVISKSSRIEACEASSSGRQIGDPAGSQQFRRREHSGVLGDDMPDPAAHQRRPAAGGAPRPGRSRRAAPAPRAARQACSQVARRVAYSLSTRACGVLVSSTRISSPARARSSATCSARRCGSRRTARARPCTERRCRLVHQAGRCSDERVLAPPGQLGSLERGDVEPARGRRARSALRTPARPRRTGRPRPGRRRSAPGRRRAPCARLPRVPRPPPRRTPASPASRAPGRRPEALGRARGSAT